MTEPGVQLGATTAAAIVLVLAAATGITSQRGIRLVIVATMISLIPETGRSVSWLWPGEIGRRCNEGRRTGTTQPSIDRPKVDR